MIKKKKKKLSMKMISSSLFAFCSPFFAHWMKEESLTNNFKSISSCKERRLQLLAERKETEKKERKKKRMLLAHSLHEELKATK